MNNLRVNIVCNYASNYGGNFIPSLFHLVNHFPKASYVIFSFPDQAKGKYWINYLETRECILYFYNSGNKIDAIKSIRKINKNERINTIYTHFLSMFLAKLLAPFNKKVQLVIHNHSDFSGGARKAFSQRLKSFVSYNFLRRDSSYIYVSQKEMLNNYGKHSFWVPNAYCKDRIPSPRMDIESFKTKYGITSKDRVMLFFGWSPFVKGLDIVIKAFLGLKNYDTKKLVVVYGKDNGQEVCDSFLIPRIGTHYKDNKNIIFIEPQPDILSLFGIADIFISASRSEGFPYSILEAIINDCIVFVSDIENTRWANNYNYVYSFPTENASALTCLMETKITINKQIFNERKQKALEEYNIEKWTCNILTIFNNIGARI